MEYRASQLIGMPIITFDSGRRLGQVEDLLVDPARNQVLALLLPKQGLLGATKVVAFGYIKAIGQNAIVVPNHGVAKDVRDIPALKAVFDGKVIRGMRVYSENGNRLGTIGDMLIDDHTGEILYYEVSGGAIGDAMKGKRTIVPTEILNMGAIVLYVAEATANRLAGQQGGVVGAIEQARARMNLLSDQAADSANRRLGRLGEQARLQQRQFIQGRTALRTVEGTEGTVIVREGETITEEVIAEAEAQGRLSALLLAGGMGEAQQQLSSLGQQANDSFAQIREEARDLWNKLTHQTQRLTSEADSRAEQARIDRAVGRPVARVILDRQDNVILNTGDIITNTAIEQARGAGVLHILLDSVYTDRPQLGLADLKAPWAGRASLEEQGPGPAIGTPSPAPALPSPPDQP
jgi:uncharacterized protein YrrD